MTCRQFGYSTIPERDHSPLIVRIQPPIYQNHGCCTDSNQDKEWTATPLIYTHHATIATPLRNAASTSFIKLTHLKGLPLAHLVTSDRKFEISLLIGADHYWDIVGDKVVRGNGPTAVGSKLGYLLLGLLIPMYTGNIINSLHAAAQCDVGDHQLDRFWNIEASGVTHTQDYNIDTRFLESYSQTCISHLPDGSYCAAFPWKQNHPALPTKLDNCRKRTRSLAHQLAQTPDLLNVYDSILKDK